MSKPRLDIMRADDTSALFDFQCGVASMDKFIHDKEKGLAKFIELKLSNLWLVYEEKKVVAFFALSKDALILNTEDARNIAQNKKLSAQLPPEDDTKFWEQEKYPAIEIDYFAAIFRSKR